MFTKCHSCKNDSKGEYRCEPCNVKNREKIRQKRENRKISGLCVDCGNKNDTKFRICSICIKEEYKKTKERDKKRFNEGKCNIGTCRDQRLFNHRFCDTHRLKHLEKSAKRFSKLVDSGLCTACGKNPFLNCFKNKAIKHKLCEKDYLKLKAIRGLNNINLWVDLLTKLKEQNHKCYYTGEVIVLGVNDSIDHILPVSRFPEKAGDIKNIVWVSRKVNWMKDNNTHREFIDTIEKIYKHRKKMEREKKVPSPSP